MRYISRALKWISANRGAFALIGSIFAALGSVATFVGEHFWAAWRAERIAETTVEDVTLRATRLLTLDCNMLGEIEHHRRRLQTTIKVSILKEIEEGLGKLSTEIDKVFTDNGAILIDLTTDNGTLARRRLAALVAAKDNSLYAIASALTAFPDGSVTDKEATLAQLWAASRYTVAAISPAAELADKSPPCATGPYVDLIVQALNDTETTPPATVDLSSVLAPADLAKPNQQVDPKTIEALTKALERSAVLSAF